MAGEGHGGLSPNVFSSLVHLPSPPGAQSCPFSLPPPQDSLEGQRSPSEAWRSAFPVSSPAVCLACLLSLKEFLFLSSSCWPGERQPLLFLPPGIGSPTDRGLGYRASALCCALSGPLMSRCPLFSVAPTGRDASATGIAMCYTTVPVGDAGWEGRWWEQWQAVVGVHLWRCFPVSFVKPCLCGQGKGREGQRWAPSFRSGLGLVSGVFIFRLCTDHLPRWCLFPAQLLVPGSSSSQAVWHLQAFMPRTWPQGGGEVPAPHSLALVPFFRPSVHRASEKPLRSEAEFGEH